MLVLGRRIYLTRRVTTLASLAVHTRRTRHDTQTSEMISDDRHYTPAHVVGPAPGAADPTSIRRPLTVPARVRRALRLASPGRRVRRPVRGSCVYYRSRLKLHV